MLNKENNIKSKKEIYVSKRCVGNDFLGINDLYNSKDHKEAGIFYKDIDIIYIKRVRKKKDIFKTIIKTKNRNKLVFNFDNGPENLNFHKKIVDNYNYYLKEHKIRAYSFHSILTRLDDIEIIETKTKKRNNKLFRGKNVKYETWEYELIVLKTKYGNKASTEKFYYEDTFRKSLAIGIFAGRDEGYQKKQ